jgi:hypothetical protein
MKKLINLRILFLLAGLPFFQIHSSFAGQSLTDLNPDKGLVTFLSNQEVSLLAETAIYRHEVTDNSEKNLHEKTLPGPPIITWITPSKQYTTLKSPKSDIKAIVKSTSGITSALLYLNDVLYGEPEMIPSATELQSFIISKTLNFEPGENNIYLVITSSEGSTTSEKRYFTIPIPAKSSDSTAAAPTTLPKITWTKPSNIKNTISSPKADIKAIVKSSFGITSAALYLNDVKYGEPEMIPSSTELQSFIISKTLNFEPGENNIYLVVTSSEGSTTSEKRYFTIPIPAKSSDSTAATTTALPKITWSRPSNINTTISSPKADIRAIVKSSSGINSALLYLNDVIYGEPEMRPSPSELESFVISKTVNFEPGKNSIYLVITSKEGSSTSEKRYFTISVPVIKADSMEITVQPAPLITWNVPSVKKTSLKSSSTNIKASIKSASALTSAVLYLNDVSLGESEVKPSPNETGIYIVEKTLNFKQVENNIILVANNTGGATRSQLISFICPPSSLKTNQSSNQIASRTSSAGPVNAPAVPVKAVTVPAASVPAVSAPAAPVITWISPSGSHISLESFNATVKANIKSNSGLKSVLLYQNGISKGETEIQSSTKDAGSYLIEKNINFGPGENNIYLVATNSEGATKSGVLYFTNPSAVVPVIKWSTPESPNSQVSIENITVGACIKSSTELRSVKLLVNGSIQVEDNLFQPSASEDCNYTWQSSIVLREGDNSIFIIAANIAGSATSEKRIIKMTTGLSEKRLALILGNSQYKNSAPLKNPVNDANLMEATLKDLGFQVIKRLDAGKDEMLSAIREFEDKLPDYNIALFYYAGHGNQVDGKNYLIPTDAKLEKPSDCKFEAVEVNLIVDEFERYQNNTNIVILDACRNNPFASWARGGEAGFKTMSFTSGTIVAYATSEGTTAADGKGSNGLYTEELVKQMALPQSINDVFMNTRVQVRKLSNNQQVPSETNKLNGPFFFKK